MIERKILIQIAVFLIFFNLLSIPLWIIIYFDITFPRAQTLLAIFLEHSLNFLKIETKREGFVLFLADPKLPQIIIDADCIGWKSSWMFVALILATPAKIKGKIKLRNIKFPKTKFKALLIGVPILFIINFLRILTTILIGRYFGINYFELAHTFLWREGLVFAVILIWLLWLRKEKIVRK